jgi:2-oxo-3-hexenedioate decarboxylase
MEGIKKLANILDEAAFTAEAIDQLSINNQIDLSDAYEIQSLSIENRYKRGEELAGLKMGFTSLAKMEQMGVHDMIWGRLTDQMAIPNEGKMDRSKFIHPRAEPEICFRVCKEITKELRQEDIANYIDGVSAAIEIIDSRYKNFKFSLEDVIADNCSSSGFIIGSWFDINTPINNLEIALLINGKIVQSGNSNAILGDPWKSVLAASRLAMQYKQVIPKGSIILAGAATAAAYVEKGQTISARVENLGTLSFHVV